jgi:hypothetical protein
MLTSTHWKPPHLLSVYTANGDTSNRRENQANLSVLRVLCGEIQLSDGKLNDAAGVDGSARI